MAASGREVTSQPMSSDPRPANAPAANKKGIAGEEGGGDKPRLAENDQAQKEVRVEAVLLYHEPEVLVQVDDDVERRI